MTKTAKDGTEFGVFDQGNGTYVAQIDDRGFHFAPPSYRRLPAWSTKQAKAELDAVVQRHETRGDSPEEEEC